MLAVWDMFDNFFDAINIAAVLRELNHRAFLAKSAARNGYFIPPNLASPTQLRSCIELMSLIISKSGKCLRMMNK